MINNISFQHRLITYHKKNPSWGSIHIAMEDGNMEDDHLKFCMKYAFENNDADGLLLAYGLLHLSKKCRESLYERMI